MDTPCFNTVYFTDHHEAPLWQEGLMPSPGPSAAVASEDHSRVLPVHVAEAVWPVA